MLSVRYKSRIGGIIIIPLVVLGLLFLFFLYHALHASPLPVVGRLPYGRSWGGVLSCLAGFGFVLYIALTTYYVVRDKVLSINCGFLINLTVDIRTIKKITETSNMLSSPALSLDRLEILYNTADTILVSPAQKAIFIHQLTTINPDIIVRLRAE